jgi:hypothetical protein
MQSPMQGATNIIYSLGSTYSLRSKIFIKFLNGGSLSEKNNHDIGVICGLPYIEF